MKWIQIQIVTLLHVERNRDEENINDKRIRVLKTTGNKQNNGISTMRDVK